MEKNVTELKKRVFIQILKAREKLYAELAAILKPHGLTEPQYNVMRIIRGAGKDGLPCLEVGRRMITRVPDITRLLERLESMGTIKRERSAKDRRVINVFLTPAGARLLKKLDGPVESVHRRQFSNLSDQELATLMGFMDKILI